MARSQKAALLFFGAKGSKDPIVRADVPLECDFLVRYTGDTVAFEIDGKLVAYPFPLPDNYKHGVELGLGGPDGAPMRYTKLKVRKLEEPKAKAGEKPN